MTLLVGYDAQGNEIELVQEEWDDKVTLQTETDWILVELLWCDKNLSYLVCSGEGETRGKGTETETRQYKVDLRNYVVNNAIVGSRPTSKPT